MCYKEAGCDGMDMINLAQVRNKWRRTEGNLLANYRPCPTEGTDKREVVVGGDRLGQKEQRERESARHP
jgi:hypothetical protein